MKTYFLFSGGLDSVAALDILSKGPDIALDDNFELIFIDYKQAAATMEYRSVLHWALKYRCKVKRLCVWDYENIVPEENQWVFYGDSVKANNPSNKDALFLPGRNIYLLTVAAVATYNRRNPSTRFLLATHKEELPGGEYNTHGDCSPKFFKAMEGSLSFGMSTPTTPVRYDISSPVADYTKKQLIEYCKMNRIDISRVWSCYGRGPEPCGTCQHCLEIIEATKPIPPPARKVVGI